MSSRQLTTRNSISSRLPENKRKEKTKLGDADLVFSYAAFLNFFFCKNIFH